MSDTAIRLSREDHREMRLLLAYSKELGSLKEGFHWLVEYLKKHSLDKGGETEQESMALELDQFIKRYRRN